MKGQPNRLVQDGGHLLGGTAIDRTSPLRFRLNGLAVSGFTGDTVLSAALASGIDTVGQLNGWPLALSTQFAPAILPVSARGDLSQAMPMARTPALTGADYRTIGASQANVMTRLKTRLGMAQRSLHINLEREGALNRPWLTAQPAAHYKTELIVIGGGVAGLSAALAGADAGLGVVLLEASPNIGGIAPLFGSQDGEAQPAQAIADLRDRVTRSDAITVWTNAEVFALRHGFVRAHVIEMIDGGPRGRVLDFAADRIVVATGTIERLPIFPGNRLPGVAGVAEAYDLAHHYGVWLGRSVALATVSNPTYRLMMLACDARLTVPRIFDARTDPQSRFIAFSKAYGIRMVSGTVPNQAIPAGKGRGVTMTPSLSNVGISRPEQQLTVDRLVVCGGWQPDLTLWHMAGGQSAWDAATARIGPRDGIDGIALAGSNTGLVTLRACIESGAQAVAALLDRDFGAVTDNLIDPLYESPDDPAPLAERDIAQPPAYFGAGHSMLDRPVVKTETWRRWVPFLRRAKGWQLADTPHPLDITDITAGVQLGAIPADTAAIVAQERVAMVTLVAPAVMDPPLPATAQGDLPTYLIGRFGGNAQLWAVAPATPRILDTGALIYRSADETDPLLAVGVVVRALDGAALALISAEFASPQAMANLRDHGRSIAVKLVTPYRAGMDLAAALSGSAGTT